MSGKTRKGHLADRNLLIHMVMKFTTLPNRRHLDIDETPRCNLVFRTGFPFSIEHYCQCMTCLFWLTPSSVSQKVVMTRGKRQAPP